MESHRITKLVMLGICTKMLVLDLGSILNAKLTEFGCELDVRNEKTEFVCRCISKVFIF